MKSLLEHIPNLVADNYCKEISDRWRECLVSFHAQRPHHDNYIDTIGTGAVIAMGAATLIATARHVLDDYQRIGGGGVIIGSRDTVSLNGMKVAGHPNQDVVLIEVPWAALHAAEATTLRAIPTSELPGSIPTSSFVIFGYPSSKNVLDARAPRDRSIFGIMLHGYEVDYASREIRFHYTKKIAIKEPWTPMNDPPALRGMSGSPIMQVSVHGTSLALRCVGVFHRWREKKWLAGYVFPQWMDEMGLAPVGR
jgi:hypothetical protein